MPPPPTWTVTGLLNYFQEVHAADDRRFAFILGAGASFHSGIPMAGQLVDRWLQELHAREDHERRPLADWATAETLAIPGFELPRAVEFYSQVFARRFADQPDEGYAYLERILHGRDPSFGYSVLAQVLATTRHRVVITTNFDNLVADALAIYTDKLPFVCGHESLAGFVRINPRRPLVIKVHRDLLLAPKNRAEELGALPEALVQSLRDLLRSYTPIVIGYGGNDGSLMGLLRDVLQPGDIPGGIYWCYWAGGGLPGEPILEVVRRHRGKLVPIQGFDELMLQLGEGLGFGRMDQRIEQRASERARKYRESVELLQRRVYPRPEPPEPIEASEELPAEDEAPSAPPPAGERAAPEPALAPTTTAVTPAVSQAAPPPSPATPLAGTRPAARPTPPAAAPEPAARVTRGLDLGAVLSARPAKREPDAPARDASPRPSSGAVGSQLRSTASDADDDAAFFTNFDPSPAAAPPASETSPPPEPTLAVAPLQQSMQALIPDDPAAHDWWTLKLNAERLPERSQRIAALRLALTSFPDQPDLLRSLGRELALANLSGESRRIYRQLEELTPNTAQLHIDLAILYLRWGARRVTGEHLEAAWNLSLARSEDASVVASIAFVAGLYLRLEHADDTAALRILRGLLPVTASPLAPLAESLARSAANLDDPGTQLYLRLLACLCGQAAPATLDAIPRWSTLTPLDPQSAWPEGPVP